MSELDHNLAEVYGDCKLELSKWTLGIDRKAPEACLLAPRESSQVKILLAACKALGIASKLGAAALRAAIDETSEARPIRRFLILAPYSTEALTKV